MTPMLCSRFQRVRVIVTGSRPTKAMPALSAARQIGPSSGLGVVTKGMPLRTVMSHPIPTPPCQSGRENQAQSRSSPISPRSVACQKRHLSPPALQQTTAA
eukprot:357001-Chlamydomonas_euryale.AAC.19